MFEQRDPDTGLIKEPSKKLEHNILFPYDSMRPIQEEMIKSILKEIEKKGNAIIHAPTGLGKTAASIAPTLKYALDNNKVVFFLTPRNTQHRIAIQTLKEISSKQNIKIKGTDIVGKKWMCIQPGVSILATNEFNEYCRAMREDKKCEYFENLKNGEALSADSQVAMSELDNLSPVTVEEIVEIGGNHKVCPYEIAMLLAAKSNVIITDYYYLFHPKIRENFLKKNDINLHDSIIIIDEGHNLPSRIKDLASEKISMGILKRAMGEAKKYNYENVGTVIERIASVLANMMPDGEDEIYVNKEIFIKRINEIINYQEIIEEFYNVADNIREEQKQSAIGSIASFLDAWLGDDLGFTRIISREKRNGQENITLSYRCLDPSLISKEVIDQAHSTIVMSGTLTPTTMYKELLGFPKEAREETFPSPFPEENRLNMVIAKTSTKFTKRSESQYREIAEIVTNIANTTPGNSAIFFPSYHLKDEIDKYLSKIEKTVFHERQEMNGSEKEETIANFKKYKKTGAVLLGVIGGNFSEGIDLPGDELKVVAMIGLPLSRPDLETKALIDYYDKKFGAGWDYGYVYPAFNLLIQSAGRCIRSETDKGVIIFIDERFTWQNYYRCFPPTWKMKISVDKYPEMIEKFFGVKAKNDHAWRNTFN
ncbi:ATP-dependent DNA helicase [Candidatus Woesearchaeota archaeon]|nr:ATP-dependent DNA helicase [Candidatus Woesearchaeota archaeon]